MDFWWHQFERWRFVELNKSSVDCFINAWYNIDINQRGQCWILHHRRREEKTKATHYGKAMVCLQFRVVHEKCNVPISRCKAKHFLGVCLCVHMTLGIFFSIATVFLGFWKWEFFFLLGSVIRIDMNMDICKVKDTRPQSRSRWTDMEYLLDPEDG